MRRVVTRRRSTVLPGGDAFQSGRPGLGVDQIGQRRIGVFPARQQLLGRVQRRALLAQPFQGYRQAVPAIRGVEQALQFVHEDDVADALHRAGGAEVDVTGVVNVAPAGWMDAVTLAPR